MYMNTRITELLGIEAPIIQGAMARIADASLAGAVSAAGGLGIIACGGAPLEWVEQQVAAARKITDKPIGANVMLMDPNAAELARLLVDLKIDVVTTGAGSPANYMDMWKEAGIKVVPVVATTALAKRMERLGADAVVAEGTESGGHVGELTTMALVPAVCDTVSIPVIAAGGVYSGADIMKFLNLGASGVQMGTRFVATHECDADERFKQSYLAARPEDVTIIKSPVGMPGRALENEFIQESRAGNKKPFKCIFHCVKTCEQEKTPYCIAQALINAMRGNLERGFAFCGANVARVNAIISVRELMDSLQKEFDEAKSSLSKSVQNVQSMLGRVAGMK